MRHPVPIYAHDPVHETSKSREYKLSPLTREEQILVGVGGAGLAAAVVVAVLFPPVALGAAALGAASLTAMAVAPSLGGTTSPYDF